MNQNTWLAGFTGAEFRRLLLPWPPSTNRIWRQGRAGVHLSKAATRYRAEVAAAVLQQGRPRFTGPLLATMEMGRPDDKARDLDNYEKAIWDALEAAGVLVNDRQVCAVLRFWGEKQNGGAVEVGIARISSPAMLELCPGWAHVQEEGLSGNGRTKKANHKSGRRRKSARKSVRIIRR